MQEIIKFINRHLVLSFGWFTLLIALFFTIFSKLTSKVKSINRIEVINLLNKEDAIIIDVRNNNEFHKGHIAGSINLSPVEIKSYHINNMNIRNKPIILVDNTGLQVQSLANFLNKKGFIKVFFLDGGISGWNRENLPLVRSKLKN